MGYPKHEGGTKSKGNVDDITFDAAGAGHVMLNTNSMQIDADVLLN